MQGVASGVGRGGVGPAPASGANAGAGIAALLAALLGGTALQLQQPVLWSVHAYGWLVLAGSLLVLPMLPALGRPRGGSARRVLAAAAGIALLAFAATGLRAQAALSQSLDPALEGRDLLVTGVVARLPQNGPAGVRFVLEVEQASDGARPVALPPRLSLAWFRADGDDAVLDAPLDGLRAGQRWRLPVRLKRPHGTLNPGGFDAELWLFEQGLGATGSVRSAGRPELLADGGAHPVERLRQRVRDAIVAAVPDARAAGVLAALAVGDQGAIERADWELFRASGIAHLVSISGLHVTMFAWLAGGCVGALWRRSARLPLWWPTPLAARTGGLLAAAGYALLAGWGVPAQRTVWMIGTAVVLTVLGVAWPWLLVLLAAAAVVAVLDPWALLQPGFWLSFVAVGLLMASSPGQRRGMPATGALPRLRAVLHEGLRTQAIATIGLAPLTLVFFGQLSLVGALANLVAIPLVTLAITPLALAGMLLPPLWQPAAWLVQALCALLERLVAWPVAVWSVPAAPPWAQGCGLLAGALAVLPLPWRLRLLAVPLALPLLWPAVPRPAEGSVELVAADVGQGMAVLVRTRGHLLVYDAGPAYGRDGDAGQRVLLPLLHYRGERAVDLLMLSHRDTDHVGGAAALLAQAHVRAVSSSLEAGHPLLAGMAAAGIAHRPCTAGSGWVWDGVRFTLLHPPAEQLRAAAGAPPKPNALSCVLRIDDAAGHRVLLAGDIEAAQEAALLAADAAALRADVLLVPHHGSRTSSTAAFLDAVRPAVAVVQAGYRNRFNHPAPAVMARYAERGIPVVRSDRCGAWTWQGGGQRCERARVRRYWNDTGSDTGNDTRNDPG